MKHLDLNKIVKNLGKDSDSRLMEKNLSEKNNTISVGEQIEGESVLQEDNMENEDLYSNENMNFEDMRKINLDNSHDFQEKLEEIQKNTN